MNEFAGRRFCRAVEIRVKGMPEAMGYPDLAFEPALHVNYAEKALAVVDGLPKFKDFPSELGGSGERLVE